MAVLQANILQFRRHNLHTDVFYNQANTEVNFERCFEGRPVYSYVTSVCHKSGIQIATPISIYIIV
jgi:hypothetical protein